MKELVGGILEESCKVSQVNHSLLEQLHEDEQTAELYRTNMMREWVIGHENSNSDDCTDSSDSDDEQPKAPSSSQTIDFTNRRMSLFADNEFKSKQTLPQKDNATPTMVPC